MSKPGTLAKLHREGRIRRRKGANKDPLRTIVGREPNEYGLVLEILECGHRQRPKKDFIGETNAYRRRCRACGRAGVATAPCVPPASPEY